VVQAVYFGLHCSATEVTTSWLKHHSVFTVDLAWPWLWEWYMENWKRKYVDKLHSFSDALPHSIQVFVWSFYLWHHDCHQDFTECITISGHRTKNYTHMLNKV